MTNNAVTENGQVVGYRCNRCDQVKTKMWGETCNECRAKDIPPKDIPQVSKRQIYMKTCEMMYDHHKILNIVDIDTALNIIKGVLQRDETTQKKN